MVLNVVIPTKLNIQWKTDSDVVIMKDVIKLLTLQAITNRIFGLN